MEQPEARGTLLVSESHPSHRGAVAAGHDAVARVGADVLEAGGNAVDAVVAMIAAGGVCEGTLTGLGGGGFMIVAGTGVPEPVMLDFFVRQPGLDRRPWLAPWESHTLEFDGIVLNYGTGPASVAVPGMARGMAHAMRRFGRLGLEAALAPAVQLARDGVALTETQAGEHAVNVALIARDPHGAEIWHPAGHTFGLGEVFRQPHLADALEEVARTDGESPHTGDIARALMSWSDARGGRIGVSDLTKYEVREIAPLTFGHDDVRIYANPEPSMGGVATVRLLEAMLEERASGATSRDVAVGNALARVLSDIDAPRTRVPEVGEPVSVRHIRDDLEPGGEHGAAQALHDRGVGGGDAPDFARSPNTTHVSAIDSDGMIAGATTTIGYGAGEFIPGTGIQLSNMLAEYDHTIVRPAGATVPSMMTPTILASPRTLVQIGSAGSDRIPHAIAQIVERMWSGMPLRVAVDAPRFSYDGRSIHAEPGMDEGALIALAEHHDVVRWAELDPYFGTTNGTAVRNGIAHAAGDPRRQAAGIVV